MSTSQHQVLLERLSIERMGSYLDVCAGDPVRALSLYEWNSSISAALYEVLGDVEVVVRNSLHDRLVTWYSSTGRPGQWFDGHCPYLSKQALDDISVAKKRLTDRGKTITSGALVAELSFGFWRFLVTNKYRSNLWPAVGMSAFPNLTDRDPRKLAQRMGRLHDLRNRIAHHEPIHTRRIDQDLADSFLVIRAVCTTSEAWARSRSRVEHVLSGRPSDTSKQS